MRLSAAAQPFNQLGTTSPVQAGLLPTVGRPVPAVLTGGDCARLASHCVVSVRQVGPPKAPGWGGGWLARQPGGLGRGRGRRGAANCGRRAGWATPARTHFRGSEQLWFGIRNRPELWNSKNLRLSPLRRAEKREKKREMIFLCFGRSASAFAQTFNLHLHGCFSPIFSRSL